MGMHLTKKFSIITVVLLIPLYLLVFNTLDDPLNPEIESFLALSEPVTPTDGHAVLYALDAPINVDVIEFGHKLINDYQLNTDPSVFNIENKIQIHTKNGCQSEVLKCFDAFKNRVRKLSELTEIDIELQRRVQFIKRYDFRSEVFEPNIDNPLPKYPVLFYVQGLTFQKLINDFLNGDTQNTLEYLYSDTENLIQLNKNSSSLILNMITVKLLINNLDLIKIFSTDNPFVHNIQELTFSDIDMKKTYSNEFRYTSNIIDDFISGKIENSFLFEEETILDISVRRAFIKSNQTINTLYDVIQTHFWHEGESFSELLQKSQSSKNIKIDNIIGDLLANANASAFFEYSLKNLQLACKITEYNISLDPKYQATSLLSQDECEIVNTKLSVDKS